MTAEAAVAEETTEAELARANFAALLRDAVFSQELRILGVGRFQLLRRKQMLLELRALYIGLWRLALERSFPTEYQKIFNAFLERHAHRHPGKDTARMLERAAEYVDMLHHKGDKDFMEVSRHLASFQQLDENGLKALSLKLALAIRASYSFIFDRLI